MSSSVPSAGATTIPVSSPAEVPASASVRLRLATLARAANDGIAEMVAAEPRRFAGMATLPLQDAAAAVAELERVRALGFFAVEIGTHVAGSPLDAPSLDAVYGAAEALGVTVFVHPYAPFGRDRLRDALTWVYPGPALADGLTTGKETGAPDTIRTCDPCLRRAVLYPAELRARRKKILI